MARSPRQDAPGRFHHLFNRAARRQVLFADRRDFRYFQLLLACAERRGELVIQGYCLMSTHFHLLAASPEGRISYTMMRIQNAYARYRNRRSRQDGPVFRGRFGSRPVTTFLYWLTLLRYLAYNPVQAGLCDHPLMYPYSSAKHFMGTRAPRWFDSAGVEQRLGLAHHGASCARDFAGVIGAPLTHGEAALVEQRMANPRVAEDDLDALYQAAPEFLARWMSRKVSAAGGRSPWLPVAAPRGVVDAIERMERELGVWTLRSGRKPHDGWQVLRAGLLHSLACISMDQAASLLGCHRATVARWACLHRMQLGEESLYAERAGIAARRALDETFPA